MNDLLRRLLFLPPQASDYARQVDSLHYFVVLTAFVGAFGVFAAALYFIVRYRRRSDTDVTPRVTPKAVHEVLFIGGPLTLFLVWFAIGYPQYVSLGLPPKDAMDVYVQGKKWMWKFAYPGGPNAIDALRVPAGRPTGTRSVSTAFGPPAYANFHIHFLPMTKTSIASFGGSWSRTNCG